ncbi:hypothetical protein ABIA14_004870 [Sinorhizobium fredii]
MQVDVPCLCNLPSALFADLGKDHDPGTDKTGLSKSRN